MAAIMFKKWGIGLAAVAFMVLGAMLHAAPPAARQETFAKANDAYEQKDYAQAKQLYRDLDDQGWGGFALAYNLGNAYYRLGRLGPARLWYERALLKDPRDDDAKHNLQIIRSQLQETEAESSDFFERWRTAFAVFLLAANLLFFGFLAAGLLGESEFVWWGRWISGILLAVCVGLYAAARVQARHPAGIVLESRVEVRTGPGDDFRVGFTAPEAQKVVLFDSVSGWTQIGVPGKGLKGWVPQNTVAPIRRPG